MTPTPPRLGRYVLISEVSRGAFGRLSTACCRVDSGEAQAALVRRLQKGPPLESDALDQLTDAARRLISAHGEHVARTISIEETDDEIGIAFEYAEGKDLRSILSLASLKHQRIPPPVALQIVLSALEGLAELRADFPEELRSAALWPDSVFVAAEGWIKLLDAPVAAAITRAPGPRKFRQLISYSAPEDFEEGTDLGQSDVFRAGVLLWEMISGKRLFGGGSTGGNIEQVQRAQIPAFEELAPEHAALAEVVMLALERDREVRYSSTDELSSALSKCGVARASNEEVAAFLRELLGSSIAVQQRAMAIAIERLPKAGGFEAVPSVAPPGMGPRKTLLGVPAPAVLPAKPSRPRLPLPPPPPPPTRARPPIGSSPLLLPSLDDLESALPSEPAPPDDATDSLSDLDLVDAPDDDNAVTLPLMQPPSSAPYPAIALPQERTEELESIAAEPPSRKFGVERRHAVAAAAALGVLLLGAGVLALVGSGEGPPEGVGTRASASADIAKPTAALERPAPSKPQPKSQASADTTKEAAAQEEPAAADAAAEKTAALNAQKPAADKKKKWSAISAAKKAQADRIAKINKAKKAKAAAAKKKQAAAKKKKGTQKTPPKSAKTGTKTAQR